MGVSVGDDDVQTRARTTRAGRRAARAVDDEDARTTRTMRRANARRWDARCDARWSSHRGERRAAMNVVSADARGRHSVARRGCSTPRARPGVENDRLRWRTRTRSCARRGGAGSRAMRARALESARAVLRRRSRARARARAMADESDLVASVRARERASGTRATREGERGFERLTEATSTRTNR